MNIVVREGKSPRHPEYAAVTRAAQEGVVSGGPSWANMWGFTCFFLSSLLQKDFFLFFKCVKYKQVSRLISQQQDMKQLFLRKHPAVMKGKATGCGHFLVTLILVLEKQFC